MPEVYLVLDGKVDAAGDQWLHIRIPMKPNGRTGWVPADMLSQLYVVRTQLTISRASKKATLRKNGRVIWQAPVGIGKSGTPTPTGNFWIRELLRGGGGAYGPWAFGTSAYSNIREWRGAPVVGIHGTNQPGLIPGAPSHGCVRVRNNKISQLVEAHADRHAGQDHLTTASRRRGPIGSTLRRSGAPRAPHDGCAIPCDVTAAYLTVNQGVVVRIHPGESAPVAAARSAGDARSGALACASRSR